MEHEPCKSRGDCYHARGARNQPREAKVLGGLIGARTTNATWGNTLEAHKVRSRTGRMGGPIGARNQPREAKVLGGRNGPHEAKVYAGRIGGRIGGRIQGRKNVESGHLARISKGVPSTADGILFRSQTEAMFYCVAQELGGEPTYEPRVIDLPGGRSYMPDFVLGRSILGIPANVPIELKPARNVGQKTLSKAIEAGAFVVYWDELV